MKTNYVSRRNFLHKSAFAAGMVPFGLSSGNSVFRRSPEEKTRHDVWVAGVSQMGIRAKTPELMVEKVLNVLERIVIYKPDFVCMPETFPFVYIESNPAMPEMVAISEKVLEQFSNFSSANRCYTVCPVFTAAGGRVFNSAVVFDRTGKRIGQYDKIHETVGMIRDGITCGALFQPVIQTEFGPVGIQICYDINWDDGWRMLQNQRAEIIFWCSAFDGGEQLNMKALQYKCFVASSTNKNTSKLCDISGVTLAKTGIWDPNFYCGRINMEKIFLPTWESLSVIAAVESKYGRQVRITTFHEEEWTIIECLSPDLCISDLKKEFGLKSHTDNLRAAEIIQNKSRI